MKFIKEHGVILDTNGNSLRFFEGTPGHVDFEETYISDLIKSGTKISKFVHTHPIEMNYLSSTDKRMMRSLAPLLYPQPVRLNVITATSSIKKFLFLKIKKYSLHEYHFVGFLESKEHWKLSGKDFRDFSIVYEGKTKLNLIKNLWQKILVKNSFC